MDKLEFSLIIHQTKNLLEKFRAFERVCGAGLIHDTGQHLNILVNWDRNFEWYSTNEDRFYLYNWTETPATRYRPTQEQLDAYFKRIFDKAEKFLVDNVKT